MCETGEPEGLCVGKWTERGRGLGLDVVVGVVVVVVGDEEDSEEEEENEFDVVNDDDE